MNELLVNKLQAGDIGIVNAGTYTGDVTINGRDATAGNPITVKAANYAVECADAVNDPDGCEINTDNRSVLNLKLAIRDSDHWHFEGLDINQFDVDDEANDGVVRYCYFDGLSTTGATVGLSLTRCANWLVEHSYFTGGGSASESPDGQDYGVRTIWTENTTLRNLYFSGSYNHNISLKRGDSNMTIERIVCEGTNNHCIIVGQEGDDHTWATESAARNLDSCASTLVDDGTTKTISDQTVRDIVIRDVFSRDAINGDDSDPPTRPFDSRATLMIDNARNVLVENLFGKAGQNASGQPIWIRNMGTGTHPGGVCGDPRENITIRGAVLIGTGTANGCIAISTLGENEASVTIENMVCHDAASASDNAVVWSASNLGHVPAWETTLRPAVTIRNSVFNDCVSAWNDTTGTISFTQSHNNFFNCGTSKGGTGAQTVEPQFDGPETVPVPTLSASYYADGTKLWDWAGTYQPIIDRFKTTNSNLIDAGTGTTAPCESTCDIGVNEFFGGSSSSSGPVVLVGHWQLNESSGTNVPDISDAGNNGTANFSSWVSGQFGNALNFDGTDDVVTVGADATLNNLAAVTVSAWIKPDTLGEGSFGRIVVKGSGTTGGWQFSLASPSVSNQLNFAVDYDSTDLNRRSVANAVSMGTWQHVAVTWTGASTAASVKFYVNGSEVSGYATNVDGVGEPADDSGADLYLGNESGGTRAFDGIIDDVRVYSGVLSASEILELASAEPPEITTVSLPSGRTTIGYGNQQLAATDGTTPYTWSLDSGSLPSGLGLGSGGVISGTPTSAGTANFTVKVTDAASATDTQPLSIMINANSVPDITTTSLPGGTVGAAYDESVSSTGGDVALLWSVLSGSLPDGLSLSNVNSQTATISGTPTGAGTSNFTLKLADVDADNDTQALSIAIAVPPPGSFNLSSPADDATGVSTTPTLDWGDASGVTSYTLLVDDNSDFSSPVINQSGISASEHAVSSALTSGTTYYWRVSAVNAGGSTQASNNDFSFTTADLVGHWKLDEGSGTTTADASGNGHTGTLQNGPVWITGADGNGLAFDGADDVVNCGSGETLDTLSAITIAAWIKPDSLGEGSYGRIAVKGAGVSGGWQFMLAGSSNPNQLNFAVEHDTTNLQRQSAINSITIGEWQHVAVTWTGSTSATDAKIYVNGTEVSGYSITTNGSGDRVEDDSANMLIGNESGGTRAFDGLIDDVHVYNRVLSGSEIQALAQAGPQVDLVGHWKLDEGSGTSTADATGSGHTGALQNGPSWSTGQIGGALSFDGSDDVVNCGDGDPLDTLSAITVAAWIKPDSLGEGSYGRIAVKGAGVPGGWQFMLAGSSNPNQLSFTVNYDTTNLQRQSAINSITIGQWQHVAVTWTGSATATNVTIYVNGAEVSGYSITTNGSGDRVADDDEDMLIGNESGGTRAFDGLIDDVRVYKSALSASDIEELYESSL